MRPFQVLGNGILKDWQLDFVIAGRDNKFKSSESRKPALRCVQSYREHMQTYSKMSALDVWYDRIDAKAALLGHSNQINGEN